MQPKSSVSRWAKKLWSIPVEVSGVLDKGSRSQVWASGVAQENTPGLSLARFFWGKKEIAIAGFAIFGPTKRSFREYFFGGLLKQIQV